MRCELELGEKLLPCLHPRGFRFLTLRFSFHWLFNLLVRRQRVSSYTEIMADSGGDVGGICGTYHNLANKGHLSLITFNRPYHILGIEHLVQYKWVSNLLEWLCSFPVRSKANHHRTTQRRLEQMGAAIATIQLDVVVPALTSHSTRTDLMSRWKRTRKRRMMLPLRTMANWYLPKTCQYNQPLSLPLPLG